MESVASLVGTVLPRDVAGLVAAYAERGHLLWRKAQFGFTQADCPYRRLDDIVIVDAELWAVCDTPKALLQLDRSDGAVVAFSHIKIDFVGGPFSTPASGSTLVFPEYQRTSQHCVDVRSRRWHRLELGTVDSYDAASALDAAGRLHTVMTLDGKMGRYAVWEHSTLQNGDGTRSSILPQVATQHWPHPGVPMYCVCDTFTDLCFVLCRLCPPTSYRGWFRQILYSGRSGHFESLPLQPSLHCYSTGRNPGMALDSCAQVLYVCDDCPDTPHYNQFIRALGYDGRPLHTVPLSDGHTSAHWYKLAVDSTRAILYVQSGRELGAYTL